MGNADLIWVGSEGRAGGSAMVTKRILCLAIKGPGNKITYIAGREVTDDGLGPWIRVIKRNGDKLSREERCYEDGSEPQLGDIIELDLKVRGQIDYRPEDWLVAPERRWRRVGSMTVEEISRYAETPEAQWLRQSAYPLTEVLEVSHSLVLIQPTRTTIQVEQEPSGHSTEMIQSLWVEFQLGDNTYRLQSRGGELYVRDNCYTLRSTLRLPLDPHSFPLSYRQVLPRCLLTLSFTKPDEDFTVAVEAVAVLPLNGWQPPPPTVLENWFESLRQSPATPLTMKAAATTRARLSDWGTVSRSRLVPALRRTADLQLSSLRLPSIRLRPRRSGGSRESTPDRSEVQWGNDGRRRWRIPGRGRRRPARWG